MVFRSYSSWRKKREEAHLSDLENQENAGQAVLVDKWQIRISQLGDGEIQGAQALKF